MFFIIFYYFILNSVNMIAMDSIKEEQLCSMIQNRQAYSSASFDNRFNYKKTLLPHNDENIVRNFAIINLILDQNLKQKIEQTKKTLLAKLKEKEEQYPANELFLIIDRKKKNPMPPSPTKEHVDDEFNRYDKKINNYKTIFLQPIAQGKKLPELHRDLSSILQKHSENAIIDEMLRRRSLVKIEIMHLIKAEQEIQDAWQDIQAYEAENTIV